jgi:mono/diheme cytochrome c family protein
MMKAVKILWILALIGVAANAKNENVGTVNMPLYKKECGSCHMAYQPALLNKNSWNAMMDNLQNHFKTDASLEPKQTMQIKEYLAAGAMGRGATVYEKISSQEWFIKEHRKLPSRYVTQQSVKSWANCGACHTKAEQGMYGERYINVPGYGRWED